MMFWAWGQFCAILRVIVKYSEIKDAWLEQDEAKTPTEL